MNTSFLNTLLLILGVGGIAFLLPLGIFYLIFSATTKDEAEKKRRLKIGLIVCISGPVLIVFVLILMLVIQFITR